MSVISTDSITRLASRLTALRKEFEDQRVDYDTRVKRWKEGIAAMKGKPLASQEPLPEKYRTALAYIFRTRETEVTIPTKVVDATPEVTIPTKVVDASPVAFLLTHFLLLLPRIVNMIDLVVVSTFWFITLRLPVEKLAHKPESLTLALRKTTDPPNEASINNL